VAAILIVVCIQIVKVEAIRDVWAINPAKRVITGATFIDTLT